MRRSMNAIRFRVRAVVRTFAVLTLLLLLARSSLHAQKTIVVTTAESLRVAVSSAKGGDTISVADGTYDLGSPLIIMNKGTPFKPIVIKSSTRLKTVFTGTSRMIVRSAEYLTIEGFVFTSTDGPAILLESANNVRITRNIFRLKETRQSSWVLITANSFDPARLSHHNRIDHNLFENKSLLGNFLTVEGSKRPVLQVSQYDRIDHNHFRNVGPRVENVLEAIRIGSSDFSLSDGYTVVESNLFEHCDGDPEVLSVKSSGNIIRYNTFLECLGVLALRHGNRNTVEGNFFLGNKRTGTFTDSTGKSWILGTGGVRLYGDSMLVFNNYFEGLTGSKWDAALAMTSGNADYGKGLSLTKHYRTRNAIIAFNTFVNNRGNIEIGYDGEGFQGNWWTLPPEDVTIANNIITGSEDTLFKIYSPPVRSRIKNNIVFPVGESAAASRRVTGVRVLDPKLTRAGNLWRLSKESVAIDSSEGAFPFVTHDIEGQFRDRRKDVGADEFSFADAARGPLHSEDVGPDAPENEGLFQFSPKEEKRQTGSSLMLFDEDELSLLKRLTLKTDRYARSVLERLRKLAEERMTRGPWSVTFNRAPVPSGDPHDYYSEAPYWWPDPKNPQGPYIRRDGEFYPDRFLAHRTDLQRMGESVFILSLAGYIFDEAAFSDRASLLVRVWFVDTLTRMNPHLQFSQAIKGRNSGRGAGIIDGRSFVWAAQGMQLLERSGKWRTEEQRIVRQWYAGLLQWMTTSENGLQEKVAGNNHSTWWAVQVAAYALFLRDEEEAGMVWQLYRGFLVPHQIRLDGSCPLEEARTRSLSYSAMNQDAFALLCRMARRNGVDLWGYATPHGASVNKAIEYLLPYIEEPGRWQKQQIRPFEKGRQVFPALAGIDLREPKYLSLYRRLPESSEIPTILTDVLVAIH